MTFTWDATATPVGTAVAVFSDDGLVAFRLSDDDPAWEVERLAVELHTAPAHAPGALAELDGQLAAYFDGDLREFDLHLDWRLVSGFARDALETIRTIPYGTTAAYGEVAVLAGRPRAARAVGTACRITPWSLVVPVHRVVRSDGTVGEYGSSPETKRFLLELEGAVSPLGRAVVRPGAPDAIR